MDSTQKSKWRVRAAALVILRAWIRGGFTSLERLQTMGQPTDEPRQNRFERIVDNLQLNAIRKLRCTNSRRPERS